MKTHPLAFGLLLKQFRGRAGLTQEALAERAGLSVQAITKLERGVHRRPHSMTMHVLARALDLSTQERAHLERAAHQRRADRQAGSRHDGVSQRDRFPAVGAVLDTLAKLQTRQPTLVDVFVLTCPEEVAALEEDTVRVTILERSATRSSLLMTPAPLDDPETIPRWDGDRVSSA